MNSLWKCKDSRDHVTRCIWPGRDNQKKQSEGKNTVRKHWGHPVRALHVKKKKKIKKEEEGKVSYLYPLLMLIIEHLTMRLRSPLSCAEQQLHFFSSWTDQSGLISWQAPFTPTPSTSIQSAVNRNLMFSSQFLLFELHICLCFLFFIGLRISATCCLSCEPNPDVYRTENRILD